MSETTLRKETASAIEVSQHHDQQSSVPTLRPQINRLLDGIAHVLADSVEIQRTGPEVRFDGRFGPTTIAARNFGLPAPDGQVILEQIMVTTEIDESLQLPPAAINYANRFAGLSALIQDPDTDRLSLVSRINTYEGWDRSLPFTTHLLTYAAMLHDEGLAAAINSIFELEDDHAYAPVPWETDQCPWGSDDFEEAVNYLEGHNVYANTSSFGLTAEYSWSRGSYSTALGHTTSLLTVDTRNPHPILGQGMFFKLELPVQLEPEALIDAANALNLLERDAIDAPPFLGAWTGIQDSGRVAHVGFFPSAIYIEGMVPPLCSWMVARNRLARGFINNRSS